MQLIHQEGGENAGVSRGWAGLPIALVAMCSQHCSGQECWEKPLWQLL